MSNQKKQYILSGIGWLNMLTLTPVLFFTILFNAQTYILQIHTEYAQQAFAMYVIQILLLLLLFLPAFFLQTKRSDKVKNQAFVFLTLCSLGVLIYIGIQRIVLPIPWHIYGWVFMQFLQSYIGTALFGVNVCSFALMHKAIENKRFTKKWMYGLFILFVILILCLYFFK